MAVSTYPVPSTASSPIKSIQRGVAGSSGNITISVVDTTKSFIRSRSASSSGYVGIDSTTYGTLSPSGGTPPIYSTSSSSHGNTGSFPAYIGTRTVSAGTTNLTSGEFGVFLVNGTTIYATGPCYWELVEYN